MFDILILGGGLVGCSMANALLGRGFKIALVERQKIRRVANANANARAIALSLPSISCLQKMKIWESLASNANPIRQVIVSKKDSFGKTTLDAKELGLNELGFVVNGEDLLQALYQPLFNNADMTLFDEHEIIHIKEIHKETNKEIKKEIKEGNEFSPLELSLLSLDDLTSFEVALSNDKTITAKFIIDASGKDSFMCRHFGVNIQSKETDQVAILCNLEIENAHEGRAYERFVNKGALALLPFGHHKTMKCIYVTSKEEKVCLKTIQDHFGTELGQFKQISPMVQFPLVRSFAETLYGPRFVLIGNAANTLLPIAAQGFNLGLRDVATLAETLIEAKKQNKDIGNIKVLQAYAKLRTKDHQRTIAFTECLNNPTIVSIGLKACFMFGPIRWQVSQLGLSKTTLLPKLCRGSNL